MSKIKVKELASFARKDVLENNERLCSFTDHNNPRLSEDARVAHRRVMQRVFHALCGQSDSVKARMGMGA